MPHISLYLSWQAELDAILKDYVGRETPLYYAERLSEHYKRCVLGSTSRGHSIGPKFSTHVAASPSGCIPLFASSSVAAQSMHLHTFS